MGELAAREKGVWHCLPAPEHKLPGQGQLYLKHNALLLGISSLLTQSVVSGVCFGRYFKHAAPVLTVLCYANAVLSASSCRRALSRRLEQRWAGFLSR